MALSTDIQAKSPEAEVPAEMELPSMESALAERGAPGLLGLLSQPAWTLKLALAVVLAGAVAVLITPAAFPPRVWRQPPPLPPRAPARMPRRLPPTPLPEWVRAPSPRSTAPVRIAVRPPVTARSNASWETTVATSPKSPLPEHVGLTYPIRIQERAGATCIVNRSWVAVDGERIPAEWARETRRLLAPPTPAQLAPAQRRAALRLSSPDPGDAAVLSPPEHLRWSPVPGVGRYVVSLEVLTDATEQIWHPVHDIFWVEVLGSQFELPADIDWAPGELYRWRVETGDGQTEVTGRFRVLSERQQVKLQAARETVGRSRLVTAAIYRSFGLYSAALAELRMLRAGEHEQPWLGRAMHNVEAEVRRQMASGNS